MYAFAAAYQLVLKAQPLGLATSFTTAESNAIQSPSPYHANASNESAARIFVNVSHAAG
jgi:hypothetical protein